MSKLADELRKKFKDPRKVIAALGLDERLLQDATREAAKLAMDAARGANMKPTRIEYMTTVGLARAVNPHLAMDAKVNYGPLTAGLTSKNFATRKPQILAGLKTALKGQIIGRDGKIAKDADLDMGHIASMLNHIEHTAEKGEPNLDESVSPEQHKAMEAAAHGKSNLGIPEEVGKEFAKADEGKTFKDAIPEFLRSKGMSEDDIGACMDMFPKSAMDSDPDDPAKKGVEGEMRQAKRDEKEVEKERADDEAMKAAADKAAKDEADKKAAADKAAADEAEKMKGMVTKDEMAKVVKEAIQANDARHREVAEARDFVRPYVGEMPIAMDSAEGILRKAASGLGFDTKDINVAGLRALIATKPKIGARPADLGQDSKTPIALDSAGMDRLSKRFPGIENITVGG